MITTPPPPSLNHFLFTAGEFDEHASTASAKEVVVKGGEVERSTKDRAAAATALRNHKEAEKRRRERINQHLNSLRALLPCSSKIDKATLLTKVVQRVRELKQQTSEIGELECIPRETDDFAVTAARNESSSSGKLILKASLSCEDRADLLPELITVIHSLRLKALKAEMCMVGGRLCNILIVAADMGEGDGEDLVMLLRNALRGIMERSRANEDSVKRRCRLHPTPLDLPL
ncbi:Transcription factor bHLH106-like protein [Drosera capensis]